MKQGGVLNYHNHRRGAKHAEDLFYFWRITAQEKCYSLCDLCALSEAGGEFILT
jgi:hypothetical protein